MWLFFAGSPLFAQEPEERIRIESDLVDLKVSVLGQPVLPVAQLLAQKDFRVLEDGVEQEIAFFAAADAPFDLVLLLDLSGSSSDKLKMIKRSAKRFVEATRSVDRIAIVTFTDRVALLSNFTLDRNELKRQIDNIKDAFGGTNFWDSLGYVLRDVITHTDGTRRSAVVVMSDGVDNALPDVAGPGSRITFDELMSTLNSSEAIVFPVYLDTEKEDVNNFHIPRAAYEMAREQLGRIAAVCGTTMYRAAKLKDLDQLYAKVISDLGRVYSIGYRPVNRMNDGKWRSVEVHLVEMPALTAKTKRGYFAKVTGVQ
jgi:VWFA-related protein